MLQDAIAGFQEAPPWAQLVMALAAIFAVVSIVEKPIQRLAGGVGLITALPPTAGGPSCFL